MITNGIGQELLITGELRDGLQDFQLGRHARLKAGSCIPQAHDGRSNRLLSNPHLLVTPLQGEIVKSDLEPEFTQSDQISLTAALIGVSRCSNLRDATGINQIPIQTSTEIG